MTLLMTVQTPFTLTVTGSVYSTPIDVTRVAKLSVQCQADVQTQTAGNFASTDVSTGNDTITISGKAYPTGLVGQFTTSGSLPTGVTTSTNYYVITDGTTAFKFASSFANAQAGTAINLTAAGSGNSTFTPTAFSGGSLSFQRCNKDASDGSGGPSLVAADWDDIDTATDVSADGDVWYSVVGPTSKWFRVKGTATAGYFSVAGYAVAVMSLS